MTWLHLVCTIGVVGIMNIYICQSDIEYQGIDRYGYIGFIILFCLKLVPCLSLPFALMNIIALIFTKLWPDQPTLEVQQSDIPFLCFRVVTRGLYKNLVVRSLQRNIEICQKIGLDKFTFEVVTDNVLDLKLSLFVREIVVPNVYITKNNSLYKARALHYCLENEINKLSDDDWIIHMDEETLLTEGSVIGLANFAAKELGSIGQGVITYANDGIVNWCTTLADSVRVAIDTGLMKFCFQKCNRPLYGLKGSYIITKAGVEKKVGFDFGPRGSIAEDLYFALEAWKKGYKFNFVEGEMWEKSPFTIFDYIKQRKRWFVGRMFTLLSTNIPIKCKLLLIPTDLSWLLLTSNILQVFLGLCFPMHTPGVIVLINSLIAGVMVFLFTFGSIKSFSVARHGVRKKCMICVWTVFIIPFAACLDGIASLYGFFWKTNDGFYIVKKEYSSPLETF